MHKHLTPVIQIVHILIGKIRPFVKNSTQVSKNVWNNSESTGWGLKLQNKYFAEIMIIQYINKVIKYIFLTLFELLFVIAKYSTRFRKCRIFTL